MSAHDVWRTYLLVECSLLCVRFVVMHGGYGSSAGPLYKSQLEPACMHVEEEDLGNAALSNACLFELSCS